MEFMHFEKMCRISIFKMEDTEAELNQETNITKKKPSIKLRFLLQLGLMLELTLAVLQFCNNAAVS